MTTPSYTFEFAHGEVYVLTLAQDALQVGEQIPHLGSFYRVVEAVPVRPSDGFYHGRFRVELGGLVDAPDPLKGLVRVPCQNTTAADKRPDFLVALRRFLDLAQALVDTRGQRVPKLAVDSQGKRYARIVAIDPDHGGKSAWAFIDVANGDILKPDGCKRPAKHARGNIFDANPVAHITAYGPEYLPR
jgi:hypothetical protein